MSSKRFYWPVIFLIVALALFGAGQGCLQGYNGNGGGYSGVKPNLNPILGNTYVRMLRGHACEGVEGKIDVISQTEVIFTDEVCTGEPALISPDEIEFLFFNPDFIAYSDMVFERTETPGLINMLPYTETLCRGSFAGTQTLHYDVVIQESQGVRVAKVYGGVFSTGETLPKYQENIISRIVSSNEVIYETASFKITINLDTSVAIIQGQLFNVDKNYSATCYLQNIP